MKRSILLFVLTAMLLTCMGGFAYSDDIDYSKKVQNPNLAIPTDDKTIMKNGNLVIEAEDMTLDTNITVKNDSTASGGKYITGGPSAVFENNFKLLENPSYMVETVVDRAGMYSIWGRFKVPNDGCDSLFLAVNSENYEYIGLDINADWKWKKIKSASFTQGKQKINFKVREPGTMIDKLIITADGSFTPTGIDDTPKDVEGEIENNVYPVPDIKPIAGHPRLYLTKDYLPVLKEKRSAPELQNAWKRLDGYAEMKFDAKLPENPSGNYSAVLLTQIEAKALKYVMDDSDKALAKEAIALAKDYMSTVTFPDISDITRQMGEVMVMGSIVYDWCYDQMTADDKDYFIRQFKQIASMKEIGYPPTNLSSIGSHAGEAEIMRDLIGAGIACYDEDKEIYELSAGRFLNEFLNSRIMFNKAGAHPQGSSYGPYRFQWEAFADVIFSRMGYDNIFGEAMNKVNYRWIYDRLPFGYIMKEGDDPTYSYGSYFGYTTNDMMSALIIGNLYRDPYIKGRWLKEFALGGYSADPLWSVLFNDPTVPAKEPDDLPLTLFNSYPLTAMTARTNWQGGLDAPTVVANMTMKEINFGDHMHRDAGSFQVYYKGSLALDAGNYQGQTGGYGAPHDMNYNKRSVAHNVITVMDPGEVETRSGTTVNDGGQRWAGANSSLFNTFAEIMDPGVIMTEELAHGAGPNPTTPEYSFLKGDLTKSYTDKVTGHDRNFVFLDLNDEDYPAAIIVFDKVDAKNKDFKKSWLLHSIEEPQVSGNTTTIARTEYGFNGKLVNQTLLPEASNLAIEKIGGEGKESWVAGENFPNPNYDGKNATEQGNWRIEASPKKASESDLFLNAMYVTDNDRNLPQLPMNKLDLGDYVGVDVKDRAVLFSKQSEVTDKAVTVNCDKETAYLIMDLKEGIWQIEGNGQTVYGESKKGENSLYFKVEPGQYKVTFSDKTDMTPVQYPAIFKTMPGDFNIFQDNLFQYMAQPNRLIDSVPYVPVKALFEKYGAQVSWNEEKGAVDILCGENAMQIKEGETTAILNGTKVTLAYAPVTIDGVMYGYPMDYSKAVRVNFRWDGIANILFPSSMQPKAQVEGVDSEKIITPAEISCSVDDGNVAENASDLDLSTRWSAEGENQWLLYDLGEVCQIDKVALAFYNGKQRQTKFDLQVSGDGKNFTTVFSGSSSGKTDGIEEFSVKKAARFIRFLGHGTNVDGNMWNSLTEMIVLQ